MARRPDAWYWFWLGVAVVFGILDMWRNSRHDKSTASDGIRTAFKTDTPQGRRRFRWCWRWFSVWFEYHITK
jgi:hypothetical protein